MGKNINILFRLRRANSLRGPFRQAGFLMDVYSSVTPARSQASWVSASHRLA